MNINFDSLPEKIPQRFKNLLGLKFGRHTVIEYAGKTKKGTTTWKCLCACGKSTIVKADVLKRGSSMSCGCLAIDNLKIRSIKHGHRYSAEYSTWNSMKSRCLNKNHKSYNSYGGRGITICNEWINSFESFLSDMGNRPSKRHSLERIDNNKGYSKDNCIWATGKSQANNKRSNRLISHNGKTQTLNAWSEETGIRPDTISQRLKLGWPINEALTLSPCKSRRLKTEALNYEQPAI
jgi:hypothetical protein